jgi:hypothetical protein
MGQQNKYTDSANVNALYILKYLKNVKPIYSLFVCVGFSKNFEKMNFIIQKAPVEQIASTLPFRGF